MERGLAILIGITAITACATLAPTTPGMITYMPKLAETLGEPLRNIGYVATALTTIGTFIAARRIGR